jgi:hypothetical protein
MSLNGKSWTDMGITWKVRDAEAYEVGRGLPLLLVEARTSWFRVCGGEMSYRRPLHKFISSGEGI